MRRTDMTTLGDARMAKKPTELPPRFYVDKNALSMAVCLFPMSIKNVPDIEYKGCVLNMSCGHYAMLAVETKEIADCGLCGGAGELLWLGGNGVLYGCIMCRSCGNVVFDLVDMESAREYIPKIVQLMDATFDTKLLCNNDN